MIFLTLLLIPVFVIPALYTLSPLHAEILAFIDLAIWVAFYCEFFIKIFVSTNYIYTLKRNWFLVIILVLPLFRVFRLVRLARFVRILRLLRLQSLVNRLKKNMRTLVHNLEYVVVTLLMVILIASFVMWHIEQSTGGNIDTFGKAVWWSVITITTVGYGDLVPTSPASQIFGGVVSLVGIVLFMLVVARITSLFVMNRVVYRQDSNIRKLNRRVQTLEKRRRK